MKLRFNLLSTMHTSVAFAASLDQDQTVKTCSLIYDLLLLAKNIRTFTEKDLKLRHFMCPSCMYFLSVSWLKVSIIIFNTLTVENLMIKKDIVYFCNNVFYS